MLNRFLNGVQSPLERRDFALTDENVKAIVTEEIDRFCFHSLVRFWRWNGFSIPMTGINIVGLPADNRGNLNMIAYWKNDRRFMKKIGRLLFQQLEQIQFPMSDSTLPALNRYSEILTREWSAYSDSTNSDYELVVDDDFEYIYSAAKQNGEFKSCMNDRGKHSFYNLVQDCKAVSLRFEGICSARAILFTAYDDLGIRYRFLERIYAESDSAAQKLLNKCKDGNLIDCHKLLGAGCGDSTAIIGVGDCAGIDFSRVRLHIKIDCEPNAPISYQDSFKFIDLKAQIAYNIDPDDCCFRLDVTDGFFPDYRRCKRCGAIIFNGDYCNDCLVETISGAVACIDDCVAVLRRNRQWDFEVKRSRDIVWSDYNEAFVLIEDSVEYEDEDGTIQYMIP